MPKISIQVCCYNAEKYLEETLNSILSQTFKDWELIIIDDGSTDGTAAIVKKYTDRNFPIVYFYQKNKGFAAARNKAVELSRGEWIAILDNDDLWRPEKLEIQSGSIQKYPDAKLHFSNSEWFAPDGSVIRKTLENNKFETGIIPDAFIKLLTDGCFIDTETVLINKKTLMEIGGWNEKYLYIADYDVFMRLAERHDIYYEDKVLAKWRIHQSQLTQAREEIMLRDFIDLFSDVLRTRNLPKEVKDRVEHILVSKQLRYSFSQLRNKNFRLFLNTLFKETEKGPLLSFASSKMRRMAGRALAGRRD